MSGAAFIALKAQVPLIPLALVGTYELLPMHTYQLNPRPLKLVIGKAIDTTGHTTKETDEFTQRLFDSISEMYYASSPLTRPALAPESEAKDFAV